MPPRSLKAPIGEWFSCFTQSSQPTSRASIGQQWHGVAGTTARTKSAAASSSLREKSDTVRLASDQRCIDEVARQLTVAQAQETRRGRHEHDAQLLPRVHPEIGAVDPGPVVIAGTTRHGSNAVLAAHR